MTTDLKSLRIQCVALKTNSTDLKNERVAYIVLREYLGQAHGIHTAQKFPNEQGRPGIKCLYTNNRIPLTATNIYSVLLPLKHTKL